MNHDQANQFQNSAGGERLYARLIHQRPEETLFSLSDDPGRKLVMVTGPEGLATLAALSPHDMLVEIGWSDAEICRRFMRERRKLRLLVFKAEANAPVATWPNVIEMTARTYPELAGKLKAVAGELERTTFKEIERQAGYSFAEVRLNGPCDPRFMTSDRLLLSAGTLAEVRAFLYHAVYLNELFSGDGYTVTRDGRRGVMEYIVPNRPLAATSIVRFDELLVPACSH